MSYQIIPGVKQDHRGRLYRHGAYPNGKLIIVPYEAEERVYDWMEPVEVESQGKPGTTYHSIAFYHQKG